MYTLEELAKLPLDTISKLCENNNEIYVLCQDDRLYEIKTSMDFPNEYRIKPINQTWQDYYLSLIGKTVGVYMNNILQGEVYLDPLEDDISSIKEKLADFVETPSLAIFVSSNNNPIGVYSINFFERLDHIKLKPYPQAFNLNGHSDGQLREIGKEIGEFGTRSDLIKEINAHVIY